MPFGNWWMKQNGQWLSQVRTRSNDRVRDSIPSGAPSALDHELPLEAAPADVEVDLGRRRPGSGTRSRRGADSPLTARISSPTQSRRSRRGIRARRQEHGLQAWRPGYGADRSTGVTPATSSPDHRRRRRSVLLAEPRGFCAGVEMAIKALAWMVRAFEPPVYCYHEIVHNRLVVERFREQGVIFVDDVAHVPPGAPLMLSAHGSAPEVVEAGPGRGPLRRERRLPAGHQGAPRGARSAPARASRSSTSGTPATTKRSARSRSRPSDPARRTRRRPRARPLRTSATPPDRDARADDPRPGRVDRRPRRPASGSPMCGPRRATTSASRRPTARPRSPRSRSAPTPSS